MNKIPPLHNTLQKAAQAQRHTPPADFKPARAGGGIMITYEHPPEPMSPLLVDVVCECGTHLTRLRKTTVINGLIRSCGCRDRRRLIANEVRLEEHRQKKMPHASMKNYKGRRSGYLIVTGHELTADDQVIWTLECACGARQRVMHQYMAHFSDRTCGSAVCKQLFAERFPRKDVPGRIRRMFPGGIPKSAWNQSLAEVRKRRRRDPVSGNLVPR